MQAWKRWSLGLWLLGMWGAGCGGSVDFEESSTQPLSKCTEGSCGIGYVCVEGACKMGCREKGDCGEGDLVCEGAGQGSLGKCVQVRVEPGQEVSKCDESTCPTGYCDGNVCKMGCRLNDDSTCPDNYVCVPPTETQGEGLGVCEPGCRTTCRDNYICDKNTNTCRPGCEVHTDGSDTCRQNYICVDSACRPGCRTDNCGTGYICDNSTNACRPGCRDDNNCGTGYICENNACRPGCRVAAPSNNTCGRNGYVCVGDNGSTAVNDPGTCKPGCYAPSDCPSQPANQTCVDSRPGVPGSCHVVVINCSVGREPCASVGTGANLRNRTCVGISSQADGSAGVCRILCREGGLTDNFSCPTGQTCVRPSGASDVEPGICEPQ